MKRWHVKPIDFGGNPDHINLGLWLAYGYRWRYRHTSHGRMLSGVCFLLTISQRQRPWRMYALYRLPF